MEHAAKMWSRERSACRKLESVQMRVGSRLLGARNTVAGVWQCRKIWNGESWRGGRKR